MLETTYSASLRDDQFAAFVDIDFPEEAKRRNRVLGSTGRDSLCGIGEHPLFSDEEELIPQSQWEQLIAEKNAKGGMCRSFVRFVNDQDGEPSCVSNATVSGHAVAQCQLFGPDRIVHLAPISLYRFVGSRNSGSSLSENLSRMKQVGCLPIDNEANRKQFAHVSPANGYGAKMPSGWEATAGLFQILEYLDIDGWAAYVSALLKGYPVVYARSGHCILAIGLVIRSGQIFVEYLNSWGQWGAALNDMFAYGVGFDSERVGKSAAYGAFAIRTVKTSPLILAA